MRLFFFHCQFN
uniref:Uncharacterized protein n=1 Tax=Arundo donax TaxID=35708 RepID=A0A0A9HNZ5_ARUDO